MLIEEIKQEEGFRSTEYKDSLGYKTIGYGTKLPLTQEEKQSIGFDGIMINRKQAEILLISRLENTKKELNESLFWLHLQPPEVQEIIFNMAYQMGVKGLLKFRKTLKYIQNGEYQKASKEGLDSLWAKQTPNRAKRLMDRLAVVK